MHRLMHRHRYVRPAGCRELALTLTLALSPAVLGACGGRTTTGSPSSASALSTSAPASSGSAATAAPASTTTGTPTTGTPTTGTPTSGTPTTGTPTSPDAKAQITANWERFFAASTPLEDRVALLENGASLREALVLRSQDPLQQQASAKVLAVEMTSATEASVTYDVSLSGQVALPAAEGIAVKQDGVWKVSANSFCALIALGATAPIPGCS